MDTGEILGKRCCQCCVLKVEEVSTIPGEDMDGNSQQREHKVQRYRGIKGLDQTREL